MAKKVEFTKDMLKRGDILINRNGDIKEWRDGNLYELKSKTLGYGRGFNNDLIGHDLAYNLKHKEKMFKIYDIVKVIRQGIVTEING